MSELTATEKAFVPSIYQLAVKAAITDDTDNLAIMAVAGSGKTRTLRLICETLPTSTSIIALCFNKSIAEEFQRKLPNNVQASTMHSLALRICKSAGQIIVDNENKKFDGIIEEFCGPMRGRTFPMIQLSADLNKLVPFVRNTMTDMTSQRDVLDMCIEYGLELQNPEQSIPFIPKVIEKLRADRIMVTFDDMLDFCVHFELPMPQCEYILVDEAQDLNRLQAAFIMRLAGSADRIRHMEEMQSYSLFSSLIEKPKPLNRTTGSRIIIVGDPRQCQPAGTMVETIHGPERIEHIRPGDELCVYSRREACFLGRGRKGKTVHKVSSRTYSGLMGTVEAGNHSTQCTPNHKWLVRMTDRSVNKWIVYLMKKGDNFRVGWCQWFQKSGLNHLGLRTRIERAEAAWILSVHDSKGEASIRESFVSTKYGLPLVMFKQANGNAVYTQKRIDSLFADLRKHGVDLHKRAIKCLREHGRDIEYPMYDGNRYRRHGRTTLSIVEACNLIPGMMSVPVYDGDRDARWEPVEVAWRHTHQMRVYSLAVEDELYVADGLTTHNSIYSFRGASPTSMVDLIDAFECRELPLSVCYRCVRSVVRAAQGVVGENAIQWHESKAEGLVERRPFEELGNTMMGLEDGDMVVCRTNAPLIRNALRLIAAGRKALIKGRDIGESLGSLIKKAQKKAGRTEDLDRFYPALHDVVRQTILGLLRQDKVTQAVGTMDRYETILAIGESCSYVSDIESGLTRIFSEVKTNGVQFSSIHKAKGLEAPRVVLLGPEKIPHPAAYYAINAKTALIQEQNMLYVGITRAMEHLILQSITPPDSGAAGSLPVFGQFADCELLYNEIRANRGK